MVRVLPVPVGPMHSTWENRDHSFKTLTGSGAGQERPPHLAVHVGGQPPPSLGLGVGGAEHGRGAHGLVVDEEHVQQVGHLHRVHGRHDDVAVAGIRHHGEWS